MKPTEVLPEPGPGAAARRRPPGRAAVGGVEFVVGGWGLYEARLRREQWHQGRAKPGRHYAGRSYIGADDAVRSLVGGGRPDAHPLRLAARRFAAALGRLEDTLCSPDEDGAWECAPAGARRAGAVVVPPLVSRDLTAFAASPTDPADADTLRELGAAALEVAAAAGVALPAVPDLAPAGYPPLPPALVAVDDDEGVLRLEGEVRPHVAALEELQAAVADRLDGAARAVAALAARRGGGPPARARGAWPRAPDPPVPVKPSAPARRTPERPARESGLAAPPSEEAARAGVAALLETGLPFSGARASAAPAAYFGFAFPGPPGAATCLTPAAVGWAAAATSRRAFAWVVFDSPEARVALRVPAQGSPGPDPAALAGWLQARLVGSPPSVATEAYLAHLRGLGLDVLERRLAPRASFRPADARLGLPELAELGALTGADLLAFDWSGFDAGLRRAAAAPVAPDGYRVAVDSRARVVGAPEAGQGAPRGAWLASRAPGPESGPAPPTLRELERCLLLAGLGLVWTFLAAPEGLYGVRPAAAAGGIGSWPELAGPAARALARARESPARISGLADAGFIAFHRPWPAGAPGRS
ncbi:MAG TPA: hypothetical protein VNI01_08025 [Elusimicrobiota bacterium]|nr:hypothetical protein [Elusimicrobiota bacterium]